MPNKATSSSNAMDRPEKRRNSGNAQNDIPSPIAKRSRRSLIANVANVAKCILPSWASGVEDCNTSEPGPSSSGVAANNNSTVPPSARANSTAHKASIGATEDRTSQRHSARTALNRDDDQDNAYHSDSGSDSSTSGCSSLSFSGGQSAQTQNMAKDSVDRAQRSASVNSRSRKDQVIDFASRSRNRSLMTSTDAPPATRDVSTNVENSAIVADMSGYNPSQSSFSLFSKPNRGVFSSTLNSTMPASLESARNRSLSSSLQKPELSVNTSLFYEGKTTFGGAANYRRLNLFAPSPYQALPRTARSNTSAASSTLSAQGNTSAKQLIQVLERMNTPVTNAKRIPVPSTRCSSSSSQKTDLSARRREARETMAQIRSNGPPTGMSSKIVSARIGRNVTPVMSGGAVVAEKGTSYLIDLEGSDISRRLNPAMPDLSMITSTPRVAGDSHAVHRDEKGGGKMRSAKGVSLHYRKPTVEEEEPQPLDEIPSVNPLPIKGLPSFSFAATTSLAPPTSSVTTVADISKNAIPVSVSGDRAEGGVKISRSPLTSLADFSNKPFDKMTDNSNQITCVNAAFPIRPPLVLVKGGTAKDSNKPSFNFRLPVELGKESEGSTNSMKDLNNISSKKSGIDNGVGILLGGNPEDKKTEPVAKKSVSWGSEFKKTEGQWDCPTCLVTNQAASQQCIACETKKPVVKSSTSTFSAPSDTAEASGEESASEWTCDTCWVKNKAAVQKCCACETAKPAKKAAPTTSSASLPGAAAWGDKFKKTSNQWSCSTCLVSNSQDAVKCVACDTPNPTKAISSIPNNQPSTTTALPQSNTGGFGSLFKMKPGWDCDTCLVRNKEGDLKCIACETAKPGSAPAQKTTEASSAAPAFKFGVPSSSGPSAAEKKESLASSVFGTTKTDKQDSPPSTFTFGIPKSTAATGDSTTPSVPSTGFKFGAPVSKESETSAPAAVTQSPFGGIKFGAPIVSSKSDSSSEAPKPTFTFGAPATSSFSQTNTATTSTSSFGSFSFGATSTAPASTTSATTPASTAPVATPAKPAFAFGGFGTPADKPTVTSNSGETSAASTPAAAPIFSLGPTKPAAPAATFTFGAPSSSGSTPATTSLASAATVFGKQTLFGETKTTTASNPSTTGTSLFGGTTFGTSLAPTSSGSLFGAAAAATATVTTAASTPATTAVSTSSATQLSFASPTNANATSGSSNAQSSTAGSLFNFVYNPDTPLCNTSAPPFVFGTPLPSGITNSGAASQKPSTGFNFGAAATTPAVPSGFSFGTPTASNSTPSGSSMFQFGTTPTTPAAPATAPTGLTAPPPTSPPTSFVFGAGATQNTTPSTPGMFAFGSTPTAGTPAPPNPAAGSTPFQFAPPQQSATVPTFNTPATPAGGFTFQQPGGPVNPFSTPGADFSGNPALANRKMKRAVRRNPKGR